MVRRNQVFFAGVLSAGQMPETGEIPLLPRIGCPRKTRPCPLRPRRRPEVLSQNQGLVEQLLQTGARDVAKASCKRLAAFTYTSRRRYRLALGIRSNEFQPEDQ